MVVKIGFIGYRNHAKRLMKIFEENKNCKIQYVFHPKKIIKHPNFTSKFLDLFSCDAIIISTPNETHFQYLKKLKNFNGYIFCEKPPVVTTQEIKYLKELSTMKKQKIFFNFNFRFRKLSENIKKTIQTKKIGNIIHIDIISTHGFAYKKEYDSSWRSKGGKNRHNIIDTVAVHYIDLLNLNFGKVKDFKYIPNNVSKNGRSFDTSLLVIEYSNGVTSSILNSYSSSFIDQIIIVGTNGYSVLRNNKFLTYFPRDTFNSKNNFITPPLKLKENIEKQSDYEKSLKNSIEFFILHAKNKKKIEKQFFDSSIETNQILLNLKNSL